MGRWGVLKTDSGDRHAAFRDFLRTLLESDGVGSVFALHKVGENSHAYGVSSEAANAERLDPLAPVMPINAARALSRITLLRPLPEKMIAVLRPCELAALVELAKLKQANLENLVLIGLECEGTHSLRPAGDSKGATEGGGTTSIRDACAACISFRPLAADIVVKLPVSDSDNQVVLEARTPAGEQILDLAKIESAPEPSDDELSQKLAAERERGAQAARERLASEVAGIDNLLRFFDDCMNCRNCRDMCPICYCKECFFDSPAFEVGPESYLKWAKKKGSLRVPTDTLLFHLGRLNHMSTSCVSCGMCAEACPREIPVDLVFRVVGERTQRLFDYAPGRDLDEEMPVSTFKEEELTEYEGASPKEKVTE